MKTILGICFVIIVCLTFGISDASAQRRSVNERQANQRERIVNGYRTGDLTARETARLAREQAHIRRLEHRLHLSGGELTNRERARLHHELNQASSHVRRQRHDRQDRPRM